MVRNDQIGGHILTCWKLHSASERYIQWKGNNVLNWPTRAPKHLQEARSVQLGGCRIQYSQKSKKKWIYTLTPFSFLLYSLPSHLLVWNSSGLIIMSCPTKCCAQYLEHHLRTSLSFINGLLAQYGPWNSLCLPETASERFHSGNMQPVKVSRVWPYHCIASPEK